ncbi:Lsr2 family DNA-binding protein [Actinomycetospora callitridis]
MRAWATEEGIEVKARGRLSKDLVGNYRSVHARR